MTSAADSSSDSGFSLLELIVFLLVVSLALTNLTGRRDTPGARQFAKFLGAQLRSARGIAIARSEKLSVVVNRRLRTIRIGVEAAPFEIPNDLKVEFSTRRATGRRVDEPRIDFFSDGSSSGGTILVGDRKHSVEVTVNWLTGGVHIDAVREDAR